MPLPVAATGPYYPSSGFYGYPTDAAVCPKNNQDRHVLWGALAIDESAQEPSCNIRRLVLQCFVLRPIYILVELK